MPPPCCDPLLPPPPPPPAHLPLNNGDDHHERPFSAKWPYPTIISTVFVIVVILKITFDILWSRHIANRSRPHHDIEQGQPRNTSIQQQPPPSQQLLKPTLIQHRSSEEKRGEEVCAICLEELKDGDWCRVLNKYNHIYHRDCIDMWLSKDIHCPLCRGSVRDGSVLL